ncbi:DUF948 domain-containing protein [Paenibacillus sp.]|jgi:uncharacterized protein YoxC|uniref:DUF948 domain-containing protein n=1 Tax=Paenibacillus sp. TaxID=58172 RepID=UPI002818E333|nr:DUF948 domain-containing protein [Paenibacillus sp.]MDR0270948.1 DUF948 domain-containing protein [Paenibacillus sp.]
MLVGVSVAVIAVAFTVLVVFLVKTLLAAKDSLEQAAQTLQEIQLTVDELGNEVKQVVRQASDVTADVQHKMKQIDPIMDSVNNLGEALSEITLAAKQTSAAVIHKFKQTNSKVAARQPAFRSAPSKSEEHKVQSHASTHASKQGDTGKEKTDPGWMKWADVASIVWQKFRN